MINITNFFPRNIQRVDTTQERAQLDTDAVGTSVLVLNLNVRYVIAYALNHLQDNSNSDNSSSTLEAPSSNNESTVLIVTDSQLSLRECMWHEKQICKELYKPISSTRQGSQEEHEVVNDPWAYLWPPPQPPPPDEYNTETPTSSQATISRSASTDDVPKQEGTEGMSGEETTKDLLSFRPHLWARIQIRYAPTIRHVLSLFRCLHLSPDSTHGKTFGPPHPDDTSAGEGFEAAVPSTPPISTGTEIGAGGGNFPAPPTLVILLGCFGRNQSLDIPRFSMLDITSTYADLRTFDEKQCMIEQSVANENERGGRGSQGGRRWIERGYDTSEDRSSGEMGRDIIREEEQFGASGCIGEEEEGDEEEELNDEELDKLKYTEYIRMVANTMAEIKDSLAWLERSSGRKPELLIVENTDRYLTTHSHQSLSSMTTPNTQQEVMPTVRELWLQTVMGYWVDSFIKIEQRSPATQQGSLREAYRLWLRTQESLNAVFTVPATATTTQMSAMSEQAFNETRPSRNTAATAVPSVAASMGAVLGVQWHFGGASNRFHIETIP